MDFIVVKDAFNAFKAVLDGYYNKDKGESIQYLGAGSIGYQLTQPDNLHRFCYKGKGGKVIPIDIKELSDGSRISLNLDMESRDFTINSIYYDFANNKFHDNFRIFGASGAFQDIKNKLITWNRVKKSQIFKDSSRILRAARLKNKLGFKIHSNMKKIIQKHSEILIRKEKNKSGLRREMDKFFEKGYPKYAEAMRDLVEIGYLQAIIKCELPHDRIEVQDPQTIFNFLKFYEKIQIFISKSIIKLASNSIKNGDEFDFDNDLELMSKVIKLNSVMKKFAFVYSCCEAEDLEGCELKETYMEMDTLFVSSKS